MNARGIAHMAMTQEAERTGTLGEALREAARAYLERHGEETHEPMRRPKCSAPRREKDWR